MRPRGATPSPRSGAEAGRTPCLKGGGQEELPHVRGQGQRPRVPDCDGAGTAGRSYSTPPRPRPEAAASGEQPTPETRGGGWEDQPQVQGAVAAREQEGLEELSHVEGQDVFRLLPLARSRLADILCCLKAILYVLKVNSLAGNLASLL